MPAYPRYFVPHTASGVTDLGLADEAVLIGAVDAFVLGGPRALKRVVVGREMTGELYLVDEQHVGDDVRRHLVTNEMSRGGKARFVDVEEVWLFAVELLEQAGDTPGENDPVALYGRLTGPWPNAGAASAVNGQLTMTRGDLMRGFVDGEPFVVDGGAFFHACVPGGPPDDTARGKGVVLCYPLLPVDAGVVGGNEAPVLQVVSSLAQALHDDLVKVASKSAFAATPLPCVDQKRAVAHLEAAGWTVRGDGAERKAGLFNTERRSLPREWATSDIVPVGKSALAALKGFPDQRSQLLWSRIRPEAPITFAPPSPHTPHTPSPPSSQPQQHVREQPFRRSAPDWMSDFNTPAPALPTSRPAPTPPPTTTTRTTTRTQAPVPQRAPVRKTDVATKTKPDWMKDFE